MSLVSKKAKQKAKERQIINPTKSYAPIYVQEGGAPYRGETPASSRTSKDFHYATPLVQTELLSAFTQLTSLLSVFPENVNETLEILKEDNLFEVKQYINTNKLAFTKNLDSVIKNWSDESNYRPSMLYNSGSITDSIQVIIECLYSIYQDICSNPKAVKEDVAAMNKYIKMLLEIKVLGLQKSNTLGIN